MARKVYKSVEEAWEECSKGWRRCMGVINPKEYRTRNLFLVHRNIPKRAIPGMGIAHGKYGSNALY